MLILRNQLVSKTELSNRFEDIRFEEPAGCWATAGVLCSTGEKRTSSTGNLLLISDISMICNIHFLSVDVKESVIFFFRNLKTAFNFKEKMQSEGIYMVENQTNVSKPGQPKKVLSVEGLRKALRYTYL
ncbi:hypothetical protein Hdeb2414_s0012g00383481 [Helianthus debilis subsp. tardiflorus]